MYNDKLSLEVYFQQFYLVSNVGPSEPQGMISLGRVVVKGMCPTASLEVAFGVRAHTHGWGPIKAS